MAGPRRVLVVDDDEQVREMLRDLLVANYDVEMRASAVVALADYRTLRPDVVLLDVHMPEMNGLDALREIKALDPNVPVIMVTGLSDKQLPSDVFRLGAFAYLPKPFQLPYAEHLIRTALQQSGR
jgi:DNA-binding NtrC family response regulator